LAFGADVERYFYRFDTGAFKVLVSEVCSIVSIPEWILYQLFDIAKSAAALNEAVIQAQYVGDRQGSYPRLSLQQLSQNNGQTLQEMCRRCNDELVRLKFWE
jgi:hypothetical protein